MPLSFAIVLFCFLYRIDMNLPLDKIRLLTSEIFYAWSISRRAILCTARFDTSPRYFSLKCKICLFTARTENLLTLRCHSSEQVGKQTYLLFFKLSFFSQLHIFGKSTYITVDSWFFEQFGVAHDMDGQTFGWLGEGVNSLLPNCKKILWHYIF